MSDEFENGEFQPEDCPPEEGCEFNEDCGECPPEDCPPEEGCEFFEDCGNMLSFDDYCILADWIRKTIELCPMLGPDQLDFLTENDNLHFDLLHLLRLRYRLFRCMELTCPPPCDECPPEDCGECPPEDCPQEECPPEDFPPEGECE